MEKQEDEEVKKKLIDLNPCFYGIVWGKESKEDFIKKILKNFLNFNCNSFETFLY